MPISSGHWGISGGGSYIDNLSHNECMEDALAVEHEVQRVDRIAYEQQRYVSLREL